jgi:Domain of unknown function (DUF1917)
MPTRKMRQLSRRDIDIDKLRKPSKTTDTPWISALRESGEYPPHSANGGKWLIFVPLEKVDEVWDQIRIATEEGRLGGEAKVATAWQNPNAANPHTKVICVYTYDCTDEQDVRRIREALRQIGFIKKLPYKADAETLAGRYANQGNKKISKYYE